MKISKIKISIIAIFTVIIAISFNKAAIYGINKSSGPTVIQYQSSDGFNITGQLDIPNRASVKKRVPLVILLHSLGGSKNDWGTFPQSIKNLGFATLCLDMRGHGLSIIDRRNKKRYWSNFKVKEFAKYPVDVNAGIKYIKDNYPEINTSKVALVGADIGANTAIITGSRSKNIKTIVLLTPTISYKGLETRIPMAEYGVHPVLIIVSKSDGFAYKGASDLIKYAQGKKQLKVYPYGGCGISLLKFQPSSKNIILNWLKTNLV